MPRTKMLRDKYIKKDFLAMVNKKMRLLGVTKKALAETLMISEPAINRKLGSEKHPGTAYFSRDELKQLFEELEFSDEEILSVFGRKIEKNKDKQIMNLLEKIGEKVGA